MRSYKTAAAILLAALSFASCSDKASISGTVEGAAQKQLVVKQLDINVYKTLDTLTADKNGNFNYKLSVAKGQPEFIYLFYGQTRIAAFLLESGEKVSVKADTLGHYTLSEGSEGSLKLAEVDKAYADFTAQMLSNINDQAVLSRTYIDHYRACTKYVIENPYSLTVVPVLFETMGGGNPVFSQQTDAILFRNAADSLKTVYPESKYVKALSNEAERRLKEFEFNRRLSTAEELSFPEIRLPDIKGEVKALSSLDAKVILLHLWNVDDPAQKMLSIDTILPLYEDYHKLGFEIYSVGISTDKAAWGAIVSGQKLPWINVCDGLGAASPALYAYNVSTLPQSILIIDGELSTKKISGEKAIRAELDKLLRR